MLQYSHMVQKKKKNPFFKDKNNNSIPDGIERIDEKMIQYFHRNSGHIARIALFVIFFWFGILKVFALSPAEPLVVALTQFIFGDLISPEAFLVWFGALEAITGFLILLPRFERLTFSLLFLHFIATAFPLAVLPEFTWEGFLIPTLTGQYIIKNLALLSLGIFLFGRLKPMSETNSWRGEERK